MELGTVLLDRWDGSAAIPLLAKAAEGLEARVGDSLELVPILSKLAWAYWLALDAPKTIPLLERCVGLIRRDAGPQDRYLASLDGLLGSAYARTGQVFRAEAALRRAVSNARIHALSERLAVSLRDLGNLLASQGRQQEALPCLKEALAVARATSELHCCIKYYRADLAAVRKASRS
jgi:tetratricopeptide (TPR) repeat protein